MYLNSNGILTVFPFPTVQLGGRLGSTNSQLIDIAEKPLSLSVPGTLTLYRSYYHQDSHFHKVHIILQ